MGFCCVFSRRIDIGVCEVPPLDHSSRDAAFSGSSSVIFQMSCQKIKRYALQGRFNFGSHHCAGCSLSNFAMDGFIHFLSRMDFAIDSLSYSSLSYQILWFIITCAIHVRFLEIHVDFEQNAGTSRLVPAERGDPLKVGFSRLCETYAKGLHQLLMSAYVSLLVPWNSILRLWNLQNPVSKTSKTPTFGTLKLQISPVKRSKSGPEKGSKSGRFWGFGDQILKVSEAKNGVSGYQKWDISW